MFPKLCVYREQIYRKRMPYDRVRLSGRKAEKLPVPLPSAGPRAKPKKQSPGSFLGWTSLRKFPGRSYYDKERFYTAP